MKKHISVLCLAARSSVYKVILILLLMAAAQAGLFLYYLQEGLKIAAAGIANTPLESLFDKPLLQAVFGAAFFAVTFFLCRTGCAFGAQPGCTLDRLSLSPVVVWLWQAVYNTSVFLILWFAEAAASMGMCVLYLHFADPSVLSVQTAFLATYRSEFLHGIIPVYDIALWVRNFVFALTLGTVTATFPFKQRRGKFAGEVLLCAVLLPGIFGCTPGEPGLSIVECVIALSIAAFSLCGVLGVFDEGLTEEEEDLP